jgi:hypothetical protein
MAQGCSFLTKSDRDLIETGGGGSGGSAGQGGSGAATATGGGGSGAAGGACPTECCSPADCPAAANECDQRTCEGGVCGTKPVAAGVPVSTQTTGDCQRLQCDGKSGIESVDDDGDLLDDGKECTVDTCEGGAPKNKPTPAGQACSEGAGIKCDGSGECAECLSPGDCTSKVCTVLGACAPPECGDGVKNGDETDTDCGGPCGATCGTGKSCDTEADCLNGVCNAMTMKCAAPTCTDDVKNGDETDTDCGGLCGSSCGPGDSCEVDEDCVGDTCSGTVCLPSCTDGIQNNAETGLDCGGPICTSTCEVGTPCFVPSDCASASCADGFCCDAPCNGTCLACSAALKGDGEDGECGPAAQGTDPHGSCNIQAPSTCGDSTGVCDGMGACEKHVAGTACGDAASCVDGLQTNPDSCDGAGTCLDAFTLECGLYACAGTTCGTTCVGDSQCAPNAYCAAMSCLVKKENGSACLGNNQCASGQCVDGVCCETACTGPCVACGVAAGGATDGLCSPVAAGSDPSGDCGPGASCDGAGVCKSANGQACAAATECVSGNCADGFCCNTPCVGQCQACSNTKKGAGANGSCGFIGVNLDPDDECPGVTACSGGGSCAYLPAGATCAINLECFTGHCVDGVCCETACAGLCVACSNAKTGGLNGTCDDVTPGTDPDDECLDPQTCAGNFGCSQP